MAASFSAWVVPQAASTAARAIGARSVSEAAEGNREGHWLGALAALGRRTCWKESPELYEQCPDRQPNPTSGPTSSSPTTTPPRSAPIAVTLAQHGERLDKLLTAIAPEFSRAHLQGLIADGRVQVEGKVSSSRLARKVKAGWRVQVELVKPAQDQAFKPEDIPLDIVYEDEHVLVVNKPAGLVVHPAAGNWSGTLLNGILFRDPQAAALPRAGIVHRLDKDTSGLMVVGPHAGGASPA